MATVSFTPDQPARVEAEWSWDERPGDETTAGASVRLKIFPSGRTAQLPDAPEVLIGRYDPAHNINPGLNLAPDGGLEGGVSRRHCKIRRQSEMYLIEDVGSANGTYVNGHRLTAYLPHVIKDGDSLQLGGVKLRVSIGS